ncbi:hypothetical protein SOV_51860 [Sporomusa ovata DSM 2662]|uniref:Uncharacterized protein n=1 Tax=Sporomusa ovata TaxID=2378 RepID=A0A0U1L1I5_9FIRM|nr:hypothetical protein [Sporomusa ovata]EQB27558.1 hypothetical protein SOV_2c04550 [Sporomusa ovata DSM 2662]CQR73405.1 hypothetical protein SpAn4DRAFT_2637 [Sporomusa ovata]
MEIEGCDSIVTGMEKTLIEKLTVRIREELVVKGITDFKIADGNFYFANAAEKTRANVIIRDYLTDLLDNDAESLM